MARYGYPPGYGPGARYDEPYGGYARAPGRARGFVPGRGYDRGYGPAPPESFEPDGSASGVYGPARYGLGPYYRRLLDRKRPDEEIKEEVEEALFYDTWVDAEAITVEVADGIVTLRGELPSYEEIRYATDDAWDVDGVRGVRSELTVRAREAAR